MRVELVRNYCPGIGLSLFGHIETDGFQAISCERHWQDNTPGESCVPAGFYYLEPHDGERYQKTYALIGERVSHQQEPGIPRYACVLHWAATGSGLQGCISAGRELRVTPGAAWLTDPSIYELVEILRASADPHHYLYIRDAISSRA